MSAKRCSIRFHASYASLALTVLLAACGGADTPAGPQAAARARPLAASDTATLDANALFKWAESTYPSLFPAGAQNQSISFEGRSYTIRHYPGTQNYLGVSGDEIYGLGPFTGNVLQAFGRLSDWRCEVLGQTCLSGVAAGAAVLAGATIEARCIGPTGTVTASTTAAADGRYKLELSAASLPCTVRATASDGKLLHSAAMGSGSGTRRTVNISPMTDLVLAYTAGTLPASVHAAFDATRASLLSEASLQAAQASVIATIRTAGVDFSGVGDVFTSALVPGAAGNAHGQALNQLNAKLVGSLTQAALADAITRTTPAAKAASIPSLPADMLLLPAAANCVALRSGSYRIVTSDLSEPSALVSFDAATLRFTGPDGSWAIAPNGKCLFKEAAGSEYAVSDAGVIVSRLEMENSIFRAAVMFPEQTHALADIAGTWNDMTMEDSTKDGQGHIHSSTRTVDEAGKIIALTYCGKDAGKVPGDCFTATSAAQGLPNMAFSVNPQGGFTLTNTTQNWSERSFFYRTGSGQFLNALGGHLSLATARRSEAMRPVGYVIEGWQLTLNTQYQVSSAMTQFKNTVRSQDAANNLVVREAVINFTTGATRPERVESDRFREGYRHRIPETVTASDGSSSNVGEWLALDLRGTGIAPVGILGSTQSLILTVQASTAP